MKNQVDYFDKCLKILKELKKDYPDIEISKHYALATGEEAFNLSDKELFLALQKHKNELDINTVSNKDLEKIISDAEDMFKDGDYNFGIDPYDEEEEL